MENKIELYLNKVFKEYLDVKNYIANIDREKIKKEVSEKVLNIDSDEESSNYFFEKLGFISILEGDLSQLQGRLFHTYEAYKDLISEKNLEIEKELKGIKFKIVYSIKGDELTLVEKEGYDYYKNNYVEGKKYAKFKMGG